MAAINFPNSPSDGDEFEFISTLGVRTIYVYNAYKGYWGLKKTGLRGPSGTISIGTVTTLDSDASATVANAGSDDSAVLNFGIPRGVRGLQGGGVTTGKSIAMAIVFGG